MINDPVAINELKVQAKSRVDWRFWCRIRVGQIGWVLFWGALVCSCSPSARADPARPPNIVFILVDDQGYYDLGCYGATEIQTPRIDAMAVAGTRFTDYYAAAPICSPSRAGLLTGCYPRRVGNEIWVHRADSRSGIHPDELTLPELLKSGGYVTACIGKWHVGFSGAIPASQSRI